MFNKKFKKQKVYNPKDLDLFLEKNAEYASTLKENKWSTLASMFLKDHPECPDGIQYLTAKIYEKLETIPDPTRAQDKEMISVDLGSEEDGPSYDIDGTDYVWESETAGKIRIPISLADDIFYEYSRYGLNLSQSETRRKNHLTIKQWNSLKNALSLYKDSNIYSPYTFENTDPALREAKVRERMAMKSKDEARIVENEYNKNIIKEYTKVIRKDKRDSFATEEFLDQLYSLMPKRKTVYVTQIPEEVTNKKETVAVIADLHIGAKTEGLLTTPDYDSSVVIKRLNEVARAINEQKSEKVTLCILGDIIETFTGLNHPNSWQGIAFGSFGANVVKEAVKILGDELFSKIANLKTIKIIGGNHDRATSDSKVDRRCTIAEIMSIMLDIMYKDYEIEFSSLVLTHDIGSSRMILAHGDKKIIKQEMFQASVRQFCGQGMNYVFTGHLHSRNVKLDKGDMRWYQVPSIFSGNYYSEENGWNAKPGFFLVQEVNGQLAITDYPLPI